MPESGSGGWVESTGHVNVAPAAAAVAGAVVHEVVDEVLVVAVQGFSAGLTRKGEDWERAD